MKIKLCLKNYSRVNIVCFFVCSLECVVFVKTQSLVEYATKKKSVSSVFYFIFFMGGGVGYDCVLDARATLKPFE